MISGEVTDKLEAVVAIRIRGSDATETDIQAIADTGFSDYLTLPQSLIDALGLTWRDVSQIRLADGTHRQVGVFEARIRWDDGWRAILVQSSESDPLLGMALLHRHFLAIDVVGNGVVTIENSDQDDEASAL